jgi:AcrR family transcriptional regulator
MKSRAGKPQRASGADDRRANAPRRRGAAREALLEAAAREFNEGGFDGTDSNRIARRAGYAPQTFYRHFKDKSDVFIEVYRHWMKDEFRQVGRAAAQGPLAAANVLISHHTEYRGFRRSLRQLSLVDPTMRAARVENRRQQLRLFDKGAYAGLDRLSRIALLLCIERVADAAADGELADLGLSPKSQARLLAETVERLSAVGGDD